MERKLGRHREAYESLEIAIGLASEDDKGGILWDAGILLWEHNDSLTVQCLCQYLLGSWKSEHSFDPLTDILLDLQGYLSVFDSAMISQELILPSMQRLGKPGMRLRGLQSVDNIISLAQRAISVDFTHGEA